MAFKKIFLIFLFSSTLFANGISGYLISINPGLKIGYNFGKKTGWFQTINIQILYIDWETMLTIGANTGVQFSLKNKSISQYFDLTTGISLFSLSFGNDFYYGQTTFDKRNFYLQYSFGLIEYLSYKVYPKKKFSEISCTIVVPLVLTNEFQFNYNFKLFQNRKYNMMSSTNFYLNTLSNQFYMK